MAPLLKNLRSKIHLYEKNIDDSLLLGAAVEICFEYILAAVELLGELQSVSQYFETFWCFTNFPLTASETKQDYYLQTWYRRIDSRVAKRLKT